MTCAGKGKPDYSKLGLKCGIEIHQQLDTAHKLFCSCPARFSEEMPVTCIERRLSAVAGETGSVDLAAVHEMEKGKSFCYKVYHDENCLVETDGEPPHAVDAEALETVLKMSLMLSCEVADELHVMRKTVVDGSNTSGFQRTMIAGLNGRLSTSEGSVGITNVCLEEDSAQIIERCQGSVVYGLDRLGIPLIEIGTAPDIQSPEHAKETAEKIGMLLRSTGKAKRGLGSIRQDINVSIARGARVEIKGSQDLKLIPTLVEKEVCRQQSILSIGEELKKRKASKATSKARDVSRLFTGSESRIMKGKKVFAIIIQDFSGMLARKITDTRTLGNEIAGYVKVRAGIKGIIHSDEDLQKYKLDSEFVHVGKEMGAKEGDTVIIMAAEKELAERTAAAIEERINQFMKGVPMEVRRALENGDTDYLRPMPGAARMYPETDVPPIRVTTDMMSGIRKDLPETWDKRIKRIGRSYSVSEDIARQLVREGSDEMFEKLGKRFDPKMVSTVLTSTFREMEREGIDIGLVTERHLEDVFSMVSDNAIAKEAIPDVLRKVAENPEKSAMDAAGGSKAVSDSDLTAIIRKVMKDKKELLSHPRREKVLMGLVMKEVRGSVDGKKVMDALIKELKKR